MEKRDFEVAVSLSEVEHATQREKDAATMMCIANGMMPHAGSHGHENWHRYIPLARLIIACVRA